MFVKLTDHVWYGNWQAPLECAQTAGSIINVAHHFRPSRGRDAYWRNLAAIPHTVPLFRLARRDKDEFTADYANELIGAIEIIKQSNAFPLLTHCQMGGHRGPSAAVFAAWHLGGRGAEWLSYLVQSAFPCYTEETKGNYRRTMIAYCRSRCA